MMTTLLVREAWFRYIRMSNQEKIEFLKLAGLQKGEEQEDDKVSG